MSSIPNVKYVKYFNVRGDHTISCDTRIDGETFDIGKNLYITDHSVVDLRTEIYVKGSIKGKGQLYVKGCVVVDGDFIFDGPIFIEGDLFVSGNLEVSWDLVVTLTDCISGKMIVNGVKIQDSLKSKLRVV